MDDAGPGAGNPDSPGSVLASLDHGEVSSFQWKIMLISGMGFFTDAYDLFVIGIVVALVRTQWHLSTGQVSLLNSATLAAAAVGAIVFGRIADILGRKRIYGFEVLVLAIGAIASSLAPNYTVMLLCRIVLGLGIGGDDPVSATIMSEYSGKNSRGRMVGLVFAMQGAGLVFGPLVTTALLASGVPDHIAWRILLGLGAIPGLAVFYFRRHIHETPHFALAGGAEDEAHAAVAHATGRGQGAASPPRVSTARHGQGVLEGFVFIVRERRLLQWIIGTAGCWMLLDFAYYGNSISSPEILRLINPRSSVLHDTVTQVVIFALFALPGYALAIHLLDTRGRRSIQWMGFAFMGASFLMMGTVPGVTTTVAPFVLLYGVSYFFTEFGPNTTTFVYPAEIFPTHVRTTGHGISAAAGKLGAFAGAFLFPVMLDSGWGIRGAEVVAGGFCLVGLVLTKALLPEPRGKSLEELSADAMSSPAGEVEYAGEAVT